MTPQSAIIPQPTQFAYFIAVNKGELTVEELLEQIENTLDRKQDIMNHIDSNDTLFTSISFGLDFWKQISDKTPEGLSVLSPIDGSFDMTATPVDVFIHIASNKPDHCLELALTFFEDIKDELNVVEDQLCFRYKDKRDFTGFIEGTENPITDQQRSDVALIQDGDFKDGSFIFSQRYAHNLDKWRVLDTDSQEKVFGRTKADSIELEDKPKTAHISRTTVENKKGEELHIIRHGLPYGTASGDKGLFFVAYTKDLSRIDSMLERMYGTSGDGISDKLLNFTTPKNGAYYFCPSEEMLSSILN